MKFSAILFLFYGNDRGYVDGDYHLVASDIYGLVKSDVLVFSSCDDQYSAVRCELALYLELTGKVESLKVGDVLAVLTSVCGVLDGYVFTVGVEVVSVGIVKVYFSEGSSENFVGHGKAE